jgi:recombination protein U
MKVPDVPRFSGSTMRANIPRPFDYLSLYKSVPVAVECKQTRTRTRFDLSNMRPQQYEQLGQFAAMGGVSYVLVNFRNTKSSPRRNVCYCLDVEDLLRWAFLETDWEAEAGKLRKSIPYEWFEQNCIELPRAKIDEGRYGWDLRAVYPFEDCYMTSYEG